tara:strand:- start:421 stop:558 length:138 start_codon:yes stop_codon:yes gene_type:complete
MFGNHLITVSRILEREELRRRMRRMRRRVSRCANMQSIQDLTTIK